jgi:hypothetical protein
MIGSLLVRCSQSPRGLNVFVLDVNEANQAYLAQLRSDVKSHPFARFLKSIFGVALCATGAMLIFTSSAATPHWVLIGTLSKIGGGWYVDTSSIKVVKEDDGSVMTFFTQALGFNGPPNETDEMIDSNREAVNCATGELFIYHERSEQWTKDPAKWDPKWRASVRHIVCKQLNAGAAAGSTAQKSLEVEIPTAKRVPGKPDLVFSPFDSRKYIDVSGYSSGSQVKDPYSGRLFIVP